MKKIFVSFLGTGKYVDCVYYVNNPTENDSPVKFVQESIIKYCFNGSENCEAIICLTNEAEKKNWDDSNDNGKITFGLNTRLSALQKSMSLKVTVVKIPDPVDEDSIWEIFKLLCDAIPENTEIFYDITHSFRSLPMLGIVLMNYLRVVKNISVSGIYYGALEKLGTIQHVLTMNESERLVPIIDLLSFDYIMRFSNAAGDFINYGQSSSLQAILMESAIPILKNTNGKDNAAKLIRDFSNRMRTFSLSIATNRGKGIISNKFVDDLIERINSLKNIDINSSFKALIPVLNKIEKKISDFNNSDILNGFKAVKWCIDHCLVQQGITILYETILTVVCSRTGVDIYDKDWRFLLSSMLNLIQQKLPFEELNILKIPNSNKEESIDFVKSLYEVINNDSICMKLCDYYCKMSDIRNSINHCGMNFDDNNKPEEFVNKLLSFYNEVWKITFTE